MSSRRSEKLTALDVDRKHRRGEPITLNDGQGLYFRKQTAHGASWTLRYKVSGRPRWMTLGNYPDMSLAEARKEARKARVLLDKQLDPLEERRAERRRNAARGSFAELAEDWFKSEVEGVVKHTEVPCRYLDNHLLPKLRHLRADEVTTGDITRILDGMRKSAPTAANDLLRYARRIFDFGVRRHRVPMNPAGGLVPKRDGGGTEHPRQRSLRGDEIATLFRVARETPSFGQVNLLATKLLLALLVRKSELIGAKWTEFDLEDRCARDKNDQGPVWRLPASRAKTKAALDIPLAPQVVEWFLTLKTFAGPSPYVFPKLRYDRRERVPHMGLDTLNAALASLKHDLQPFTVHDLRRTGRTHLAALGVRREVAERCLGHKFKGVEGTYDTHPYFKERRAALESWADLLCEIERDGSKVTPIRERKRR